VLVYEKAGDHIGWHYDYSFYNGRHFTVLLSLMNSDVSGTASSSSNLLVRTTDAVRVVPTPPNALVLFEGEHVNHRVTPLGFGERRVVLSMTFCTDPSSGFVKSMERRFKDIAYFGLRALWT
jgi:hypothetical protein